MASRTTVWPAEAADQTPSPVRCLLAGCRAGIVAALLVPGQSLLAAAPVEDSEALPSNATRNESAAQSADAARESAGTNTLYYQLQLLQDDVRRLQGIVEEQNHRIERLAQEQRARYIELDQRLLELDRSPPATATLPVDGSAVAEPRTELDAYNAAFALVNNAGALVASERQLAYQQALGLFDALIANYPAGEFTPNAYYWKGEIHLYSDDLELARQAFVQVVNLFGDHPKVPDALYKLGVVYHRLGENRSALEYLDRVVAEHPRHTAAGLARSYAAELR